MAKFLTVDECAGELRVTRPVILKLMRQRRLAFVQIARGQFRILDPEPALRQHLITEPLSRFPLIAVAEAAEVLGITEWNLRWMMRQKMAKPVRIDGRVHFTVQEIRRLAILRSKLRGHRAATYNPLVLRWVRGQLEKDARVTSAAIQEIIDRFLLMPPPHRSQAVVEMWALIDKMNELLNRVAL